MRNVMLKAQELAQAIVESSVYQRMQTAEAQATSDQDAAKAIAAFMEKRQAVNDMLGQDDVDREALAKLGEEMDAAEKALDEVPAIREMQESRSRFNQMMENVNQILRLIISGETEDGGCSGSCSGCSNCSTCGGCGE
ncbi:MAG: YlbF family regulator [Clostridia bacterium]|nr:YlbF family regulator [Clostridia bacterium]